LFSLKLLFSKKQSCQCNARTAQQRIAVDLSLFFRFFLIFFRISNSIEASSDCCHFSSLPVDAFKNMYHIFKIFLLLITAHHSWTSKYYCGPSDNAFYRFLSQLLTIPCEQHRINSCCLKHDQCYDDCSVTQLACDTLFCDCLKNIQTNFYCRRIIQPIHCNFPQWFGKSYKCNSRRERCTLEDESEDKNRTQ
uniref:Phospholipase A2 n=1 Tax=Brugia timori TaxID=42155 RepID=A0A0R3Q3L1_9BILA